MIPFTFDVTSERDGANAGLKIGITQQITSEREKSGRGDKSHGLTGPLGDAGPVSGNPMQINGPQPTYTQPNPAPVATTTAPPKNVNAMQIPSTAPAPYVQPDYRNPQGRAGSVSTRANPMGL